MKTLILKDGRKVRSDGPIGVVQAMSEAEITPEGNIKWPNDPASPANVGWIVLNYYDHESAKREIEKQRKPLRHFGLIATPIEPRWRLADDGAMLTWKVQIASQAD